MKILWAKRGTVAGRHGWQDSIVQCPAASRQKSSGQLLWFTVVSEGGDKGTIYKITPARTLPPLTASAPRPTVLTVRPEGSASLHSHLNHKDVIHVLSGLEARLSQGGYLHILELVLAEKSIPSRAFWFTGIRVNLCAVAGSGRLFTPRFSCKSSLRFTVSALRRSIVEHGVFQGKRREVRRLAAVSVAVPVRMRSQIEFEGWINGAGDLLPLRRKA